MEFKAITNILLFSFRARQSLLAIGGESPKVPLPVDDMYSWFRGRLGDPAGIPLAIRLSPGHLG